MRSIRHSSPVALFRFQVAMPSTPKPPGRPDCKSAKDCVGNPALELIMHNTNSDTKGDMYCAECWSVALMSTPNLDGVVVAKANERGPSAKKQKTATQSSSSPAPADATATGPSQSCSLAPADVTAAGPSQSNASPPPDADSFATNCPADASAGSKLMSAIVAATGERLNDCWGVECDHGWELWEPLSNSGQPKEFDDTPGSEVVHTSKNGKHKYRTKFLTFVEGIQTNVKTGTQRRLRGFA